MLGILLAGGIGSRLYPATFAVSKQLLPVFDKPMIYYPLSTLMLAGIRNFLVISTPSDLPRFRALLGDGKQLGIQISYEAQERPEGIAQAFLIAEPYIQKQRVALILGDNIFYGHDLVKVLQSKVREDNGPTIFGYHVKDPSRYGVAVFDEKNKVIDIEEKPMQPKSNYAIPGLYFYDYDVAEIARSLSFSDRGELEITDINRAYLQEGRLNIEILGRGFAWLDTGTFEALSSASSFVQSIQERQGVKIACIEEVAYRMGYIDEKQLRSLAKGYSNEYGEYLKSFLEDCAFSIPS